jgi:hypothetical protein
MDQVDLQQSYSTATDYEMKREKRDGDGGQGFTIHKKAEECGPQQNTTAA